MLINKLVYYRLEEYIVIMIQVNLIYQKDANLLLQNKHHVQLPLRSIFQFVWIFLNNVNSIQLIYNV